MLSRVQTEEYVTSRRRLTWGFLGLFEIGADVKPFVCISEFDVRRVRYVRQRVGFKDDKITDIGQIAPDALVGRPSIFISAVDSSVLMMRMASL